jgi:hypothetical protein
MSFVSEQRFVVATGTALILGNAGSHEDRLSTSPNAQEMPIAPDGTGRLYFPASSMKRLALLASLLFAVSLCGSTHGCARSDAADHQCFGV